MKTETEIRAMLKKQKENGENLYDEQENYKEQYRKSRSKNGKNKILKKMTLTEMRSMLNTQTEMALAWILGKPFELGISTYNELIKIRMENIINYMRTFDGDLTSDDLFTFIYKIPTKKEVMEKAK